MSDRLFVPPGKDRWPEPGKYSATKSMDDGSRSAIFACPDCDVVAKLSDHTIAENGEVSPSVVCDCGFHRFITLQDWDGGP